jgi:hypothetical protein
VLLIPAASLLTTAASQHQQRSIRCLRTRSLSKPATSPTTAGSNGIIVNNCSSGTITFSSPAVTLTTTTNAGVTLTNNTGTTIDFSGGNLDVVTTTGKAFTATGGGTVRVAGASNTLPRTSRGHGQTPF